MEEIVLEIEQAISQLGDRPGLCLYYAKETITVLRRHGFDAVIQAGSLQWPCLRDDDGVSPTHFAYMWDKSNPINSIHLALGVLPEIHCWVGLVDRQEIVDFSVRHLKDAAVQHGVEWTADDPPKYLWCPANDTPGDVRYIPDPVASVFVGMLLGL